MCRFVAYLGMPLLINDVISRPKDSLIHQSMSAQESDIKLNGDGFGIGWYNPAASDMPAVFVSVLPAWNDVNLRMMSHQIISPCFFGHVRAAQEGAVTYDNCHPFHHKEFLFMHNGSVGGYHKIKLALFNFINPDYFLQIRGQTDSEVLFAVWKTHFFKTSGDVAGMVHAWQETIATIERLQAEHGVTHANYISAVVTNGKEMAAIRYSTDKSYQLSLHYATGKAFVHTKTGCHMLPADTTMPPTVLIASEKITTNSDEWHDVPAQSILSVSHVKHIEIIPIKKV